MTDPSKDTVHKRPTKVIIILSFKAESNIGFGKEAGRRLEVRVSVHDRHNDSCFKVIHIRG